jgi:hypothetical protein
MAMSQRKRGGPSYGPFAVLRIWPYVEYYATEKDALRRLSKLTPAERAALVNRQTGLTRCRADQLQLVRERLQQAGTAPESFERTGGVGTYLKRKWRET